MNSSHLKPAQVAKLRRDLAKMADYHRRLAARCEALLEPEDPLRREAVRAREAVGELERAAAELKRHGDTGTG